MKRFLNDVWIMTRRNIFKYQRIPTLIAFASIQPVMFLLLFNFVFGGAITGEEENYALFLVPGLITQTVLFGSTQTAVGLAEDMKKGIIERFRSLPMTDTAVMLGRSIADTGRNLLVAIIMIAVGYLIGFEMLNGVLPSIVAVLLILLFGFAVSWVMILLGLTVKDPESTNTASFLVIFPITFASNVFVPTQTMPGWLQAFANNQPVSYAADAVRGLMVTGEGYDAIWKLCIWIVAILAVFIPLSVRRFRN